MAGWGGQIRKGLSTFFFQILKVYMSSPKLYDSAYPGSMFPRKEGGYVEATDHVSLAAQLVATIEAQKRQIEDLEALVESMKINE